MRRCRGWVQQLRQRGCSSRRIAAADRTALPPGSGAAESGSSRDPAAPAWLPEGGAPWRSWYSLSQRRRRRSFTSSFSSMQPAQSGGGAGGTARDAKRPQYAAPSPCCCTSSASTSCSCKESLPASRMPLLKRQRERGAARREALAGLQRPSILLTSPALPHHCTCQAVASWPRALPHFLIFCAQIFSRPARPFCISLLPTPSGLSSLYKGLHPPAAPHGLLGAPLDTRLTPAAAPRRSSPSHNGAHAVRRQRAAARPGRGVSPVPPSPAGPRGAPGARPGLSGATAWAAAGLRGPGSPPPSPERGGPQGGRPPARPQPAGCASQLTLAPRRATLSRPDPPAGPVWRWRCRGVRGGRRRGPQLG